MLGAAFTSHTRPRYYSTLFACCFITSFASIPVPSFGQQPAGVSTNSTLEPRPSVTKKGTASTERKSNSVRRKRSGPQSSPDSEINATPAEGQSDLLKVLQPGPRQTKK